MTDDALSANAILNLRVEDRWPDGWSIEQGYPPFHVCELCGGRVKVSEHGESWDYRHTLRDCLDGLFATVRKLEESR